MIYSEFPMLQRGISQVTSPTQGSEGHPPTPQKRKPLSADCPWDPHGSSESGTEAPGSPVTQKSRSQLGTLLLLHTRCPVTRALGLGGALMGHLHRR